MLDDRTRTADPEMAHALLWGVDDNVTGWDALLGAGEDGDVSIYAAAARATDCQICRRPTSTWAAWTSFATRTWPTRPGWPAAACRRSCTSCPAFPNAFDILAPGSSVARRALDGRLRFLREL